MNDSPATHWDAIHAVQHLEELVGRSSALDYIIGRLTLNRPELIVEAATHELQARYRLGDQLTLL